MVFSRRFLIDLKLFLLGGLALVVCASGGRARGAGLPSWYGGVCVKATQLRGGKGRGGGKSGQEME